MNIAYVGNFEPRHSTETHIAATLEDMGHEVRRIQERPSLPKGLNLADVAGADLFLWTRTWPGFVAQSDLDVIGRQMPTASFQLDLYVGLERQEGLRKDPFWHTNHVFTPDGDPDSAVIFEQNGINHHWLPAAVYKPEAVPGRYRDDLASDIVFVGKTHGYHVEWPYRERLYAWLKATFGNRVKFYGQRPYPVMRNQDLNDLYASTKIVIGDSLCLGYKHKNYWSDRIYETVGRGGFIIHPWVAGIESQFENRTEVQYYGYNRFNDLFELIRWYLQNDGYREAIRRKAYDRCVREHTYHNRLATMLEVIGEA